MSSPNVILSEALQLEVGGTYVFIPYINEASIVVIWNYDGPVRNQGLLTQNTI